MEPETLSTAGDLLAAQVNSLVAENAMKWQVIHPLPGNTPASYNFSRADAIAAFARQHRMLSCAGTTWCGTSRCLDGCFEEQREPRHGKRCWTSFGTT